MKYKYLFGPVPSRRLGLSLGVDLVPFKTCSLNCVYCECGQTTQVTRTRKEYVPVAIVLQELKDFLGSAPSLDTITFSGSGEPTLHSRIGEVISYIKKEFPGYRTALLTNGCLFESKSVRKECFLLDLVLPSLDAGSEETYKKINRPHKGLSFVSLVQGLSDFRREYSGKIWLEVFILPGVNDSEKEVDLLLGAVKKINPDKVQLNTLDRPGAEPGLHPASLKRVEEIAVQFEKVLPVEIIASFSDDKKERKRTIKDAESAIMGMIARRPCTVQDLSGVLGMDEEKIRQCLIRFCDQGNAFQEESLRGTFYRVKKA